VAAGKGRLAVLREEPRAFEIREYPVPEPEPGAVLARVTMAGVCGSDLHAWRGELKSDAPWGAAQGSGTAQGHEMVGVVERLGDGVTADSSGNPLREGDRVCHMIFAPCFHCPSCTRSTYSLCPNLRGLFRHPDEWPHFSGTFADYYYVPPRHFIYRIPDSLPDQIVASVNCAMAATMDALKGVGQLQGATVVILGMGGLGLSSAAIAKDMGAYQVIAVDRIAERLALATEFGADYTIRVADFPAPAERIDRVRELTELNAGADLVVEVAGVADLVPEGVAMLRDGGTLLEIGNVVPGQTIQFDPSTIRRRKKLIGSAGYDPSTIPMVLKFLERTRNRYPFEKLCSHVFSLDQIDQAFEAADWQGGGTDVIRAYLRP